MSSFRTFDCSNGEQAARLQTWASMHLDTFTRFEMMTIGDKRKGGENWIPIYGILQMDSQGAYIVSREHGDPVPFADLRFKYRMEKPLDRKDTPPPSSDVIETAAQVAEQVAQNVANSVAQQVDHQQQQIHHVAQQVQQTQQQQQDLLAQQQHQQQVLARQQQQQAQQSMARACTTDERLDQLAADMRGRHASFSTTEKKLDQLSRVVERLAHSIESISTARSSISPAPQPPTSGQPLVLGSPSSTGIGATASNPLLVGSTSQPAGGATTPSPNRKSASLWQTLPESSEPRPQPNARADDLVAQQALRMTAEAESRDPIWDSHRLPSRDIFGAADEQILRRLPRLHIVKKEPAFDHLRRALKTLCEFLAKHANKTPAQVREEFTALLSRQADDAGFSLDSAAALHSALVTLSDTSAGEASRSQAWWTIGLSYLRTHKEYFPRVGRLLLAQLAVVPSGEREVADWTSKKSLVPAAAEVHLPLRGSGGF